MAAGAGVELVDEYGTTMLMRWCSDRSVTVEQIETLLGLGVDPAARMPDGRTMLHLLATTQRRPHADHPRRIAQLLHAAGNPVDARDNRRHTPLHCALDPDDGELSMLPVLLDLGADPNARTAGGTTPLHLAAGTARRRAVMLRLLLDAGADPGCATGLSSGRLISSPRPRQSLNALRLGIDMHHATGRRHSSPPFHRAGSVGNGGSAGRQTGA